MAWRGRQLPLAGAASLVLLLLIVLAYRPAIDGPFLFDDHVNIVNNAAIRGSTSLGDVPGAAVSRDNLNRNRPLANGSFALNVALAGMRPSAFRWVNVGILFLSGIALFLFSRAFCELAGLPRLALPIAAATTALWTLNPLHTNDVTYIVQRMALLANGLHLLALFLYLRGRERGKPLLLAAAGLAFLAALASKETAAMVPFAVLLFELTLFRESHPASRRKAIAVLLLASLAAFFLLAGFRYADGYASRPFTLGERLLTEPRVVLLSLSLFFLPLPDRLSIDHDLPASSSLLDPPSTILAVGLLLAVLAASVVLRRRRMFTAVGLGLFLLHLVIEFTVIPLELMFEHRILLPAAFVTLLAAGGMIGLLDRLLARDRPRRWVMLALLVAVCLLLAAGTHARNRVWGSEVGLWEDAAKKGPGKARIWNNLGLAYDLAGRKADAERAFRTALGLTAGAVETRTNLALLYESVGSPDAALAVLRGSANQPTRGYEGYRAFNAALFLELSGRKEEAIDAYRQAAPLFPGHTEVYSRLARLLNNGRRFTEALQAIGEGQKIGGTDPYLAHESGRALHGLGRDAEAREAYSGNLAANPTFAASHFNLGVLCFTLGDLACARENLLAFLSLAPNDPTAGVAGGILSQIAPGAGSANLPDQR